MDTSSWLDTKGNPVSVPSGSVEVTITDTMTGETVGNYTLAQGSWSTTFEGTNGHVYSVECAAADDIATVSQSSTTITGAHPTVTVKGRVAAASYKIYVNNTSWSPVDPIGTTENTTAEITANLQTWAAEPFTITVDSNTPNVDDISYNVDTDAHKLTITLEGISAISRVENAV